MCSLHCLFCLAFIPFALLHSLVIQAWPTARNHSSVPALFVFGDSTVDPGNNDFYKTIFKSNFAPYGVDYDNSIPTGRFTNGKLPSDFVASYLGIKSHIPPYLDPSLSLRDLMTGVSFASAGSGYDPFTSTTNGVISMSKQLEFFAEYKARLTSSVGKRRAIHIIKKAIYVISCGTNDFIQSRPLAQNDYVYQLYILKLSEQFIQTTTCTSALQAEALAALHTTKEAATQSINRIVIESDNLSIINVTKDVWHIPWQIDAIVKDIKTYLRSFQEVRIFHCYREANQAADILASPNCDSNITSFLQHGVWDLNHCNLHDFCVMMTERKLVGLTTSNRLLLRKFVIVIRSDDVR